MPDKATINGGCLCGKIQFTATPVNTTVGACHCGMCRKWGGGPLMTVDCGTTVRFQETEYISIYHSSEWAERGFCAHCGSHLFYRLKESGQYFIPAGLFDVCDNFIFDHQVFIDRKPSYYNFAEKTNNMTEAEIFAMYAPTSG
ncbi:MAG: GFA family protein [Candidatus Thiodiazotropha sp. (ex Notomyrtea botanica)]|nr:GFA family protein [Candidatus Thiodiazotropha sp. (ex Notomyrtea botanica)]